MDSETQDLLLQKLEEYVYDEDKIVTYKWLSYTLEISIEEAKKLLNKFLEDQRQIKPNELSAVYLISGRNSDGLLVSIVKENELEEKRTQFNTISNEFIYSVQKVKEIDLNALILIEQELREKLILGSIKANNCIKRTLRARQAKPTNSSVATTSTTSTKPKNSFFANVVPKNKIEDKSNVKQEKPEVKQKPSNGITNFFHKESSQPIKNKKDKIKEEKSKSPLNENSQLDDSPQTVENKIAVKKEVSSFSEEASSQEQEKSQSTKSKTAKRQRKNNKSNQVAKRRKRILQQGDSDSDDIFGSDHQESDKKVESSDDEPTFTPQKTLPPKNKKRKLVDKTFADEDGFILTKKEWVLESGSEGEEKKDEQTEPQIVQENKVQKTEKLERAEIKSSNNKNKKGKKQHGNQLTLMSFFKKN